MSGRDCGRTDRRGVEEPPPLPTSATCLGSPRNKTPRSDSLPLGNARRKALTLLSSKTSPESGPKGRQISPDPFGSQNTPETGAWGCSLRKTKKINLRLSRWRWGGGVGEQLFRWRLFLDWAGCLAADLVKNPGGRPSPSQLLSLTTAVGLKKTE